MTELESKDILTMASQVESRHGKTAESFAKFLGLTSIQHGDGRDVETSSTVITRLEYLDAHGLCDIIESDNIPLVTLAC